MPSTSSPPTCPLSELGLPHGAHWWQPRGRSWRSRLDCLGLDKFLSDTSPTVQAVDAGRDLVASLSREVRRRVLVIPDDLAPPPVKIPAARVRDLIRAVEGT